MKTPDIPSDTLSRDTEVNTEKLKPEIIQVVASGERNWGQEGTETFQYTRFGMGREEGGGREGCPQPFPWLLCVWVIIIFVTIPNQIRLQAGGAGGPGMRKANNNKKNKNKIKKNPEC